jgi:hypothetical protein
LAQKVGDKVSEGDILAEIKIKATMEFESFNEGTLLYRIPAGETAPVDSLLAIIGKKERIFRHYFQENSRGNSSRHSKTYFRGSSCSRNYQRVNFSDDFFTKRSSGNNDASFKRR